MPPFLNTYKFLTRHPLTKQQKLRTFGRFARWQLRSQINAEVIVPWVHETKLAGRRGMTGATGNIYCGLHEFPDMGFLLHFLRPEDTFVDVGANVGSYTVLASGVAGAKSLAIEPDPVTAGHLARNIEINGLTERVEICRCVVGATDGQVNFTVGLDTVNRIAADGDRNTRIVPQRTLDTLTSNCVPTVVKLDVEGHEFSALLGARNMLAMPSLHAIETEGQSEDVVSILTEAGFERGYYDPFTRHLMTVPGASHHSNALFIRDRAFVLQRLQTAPSIQVLGHTL